MEGVWSLPNDPSLCTHDVKRKRFITVEDMNSWEGLGLKKYRGLAK